MSIFGVVIMKSVISISDEIMVINTMKNTININEIDNRRFMFLPEKSLLVLGKQYGKSTSVINSHAVELHQAGVTESYDSFIKGWVGSGRGFPYGVIHFSPSIDEKNIKMFDRAFDTLSMFSENGAAAKTLIRGFGRQWEQPLSAVFPEICERKSLKEQIEKAEIRRTPKKVVYKSTIFEPEF